jgi:hypothetical protein
VPVSTTRLSDRVTLSRDECSRKEAEKTLSNWLAARNLLPGFKKPEAQSGGRKVESQGRISWEEAMANKPTAEDARLILELYDLRREPEIRKARQWWLTTFWPKDADEFMQVAMAFGSEENNWLRQVVSYWGIATSFVLNGVVSEKLFFEPAFCGELFFIFAKVRPFLKEIREKIQSPDLFRVVEQAILGSKLGRAQFERVEARVAVIRQQRGG